ncbi:EpsG family protein [Paenibacillus sp. 5J-6]|uniref:EpsG family protein n=1 Tax=Paenibacillus silvestris TaxID=2606219 RepID=A0A6L8V0E1_9BACL|nr:EpsG family protein [Paenibacillus silvestris]MZQ83644.1 EpsG family protein [Paenibacillus silvestris]
MTLIWINLALVYSLSLVSRVFPLSTTMGSSLVKPNKIIAFFVACLLILVSGLRKNIGDTYFYKLTYTNVPTYTWEHISSAKEKGFIFLQLLLNKITPDPQILIFTTALLTNALIVMVLYRYSKLFELSIYTYITSGLYIISMNGMRQFLAGAILFAGTKYLMEGNWKRYMLLVLLASSIHQSALILIPIYFIVRRKAWTKTTMLLLAAAIFAAIGYNQISSVIFESVGDYGQYQDFQEGGANIIRVVVQTAPLLVAYFGRKKLRELFPKSDYIVNMALLGSIFMIISLQNWIFARFIIYFGLYNVIILSWVVHLFVKREQKLIYYVLLICYLAYSYYENVISLNLNYLSDYLSF